MTRRIWKRKYVDLGMRGTCVSLASNDFLRLLDVKEELEDPAIVKENSREF